MQAEGIGQKRKAVTENPAYYKKLGFMGDYRPQSSLTKVTTSSIKILKNRNYIYNV